MITGRNVMSAMQHDCQLTQWWENRLRSMHALENTDTGIWAALMKESKDSEEWKNLLCLHQSLRLSAFPLLRAVCSIAESMSTQDRAQAALDAKPCYNYSDDDDDEARFPDISRAGADWGLLYWVGAPAIVKVAQHTVRWLLHELDPDWTHSLSSKLSMNDQDTLHWASALQHAMRVKLRPVGGWTDIGDSLLLVLCEVLAAPGHVLVRQAQAEFVRRHSLAEKQFLSRGESTTVEFQKRWSKKKRQAEVEASHSVPIETARLKKLEEDMVSTHNTSGSL